MIAIRSCPWIRNRAENSGSVAAGPVRDRSITIMSSKTVA